MSGKVVVNSKKENKQKDEPIVKGSGADGVSDHTGNVNKEPVEVVPVENNYDIEEAIGKIAIRERGSEALAVTGYMVLIIGSLSLSAFFLFKLLCVSVLNVFALLLASTSVAVLLGCVAASVLERSFSNKVNAYTNVIRAKHKQCKDLKENSLSPDSGANNAADTDVKDKIEAYKKESLKRNTNDYAIALLYVLWLAMCIVLASINITTNTLMFTTKQFIWMVGTATCVAGYVVSKCLNNRIAEYRVKSPRLSRSADNECCALLTDDINDQLPYKVDGRFYAFKGAYFDKSLSTVDSLGEFKAGCTTTKVGSLGEFKESGTASLGEV